MQNRAAVLNEQPGKWQIVDVELDEPKAGEVLVEMAAAGLCHSDDHVAIGDAILPPELFPLCGGHEGAGVVRAVGPEVHDLVPGDHIVTSFIPSCGHCRWCVTGLQNLCDNGAKLMTGTQMDDTFRMHWGGKPVGTFTMLGTFSEWQVYDADSVIKIPVDVPLDVACLTACGVPTGWGSAVNGAEVGPGDVVIVMGVGGLGMNAVQGARHCGAAHIIAVDPVDFKRNEAKRFGASESFSGMAEATEFARSITNGQGADSAIVTVGVIQGRDIAEAFSAIRKGGTVVVAAQGSTTTNGIPIDLYEISMYQKRIQGVLYGMGAPRREVLRLIDLYRRGHLLLDELITHRYELEQINDAYADMRAGINIRGVVTLGAQ